MRIQVRLASALASKTGRPQLSVELHEGARIEDLLRNLSDHHPELPEQWTGVLPVIAGNHVDRDRHLSDGDEVALLLPTSGG
jgi:molybdopterin converting factor small subunit